MEAGLTRVLPVLRAVIVSRIVANARPALAAMTKDLPVFATILPQIATQAFLRRKQRPPPSGGCLAFWLWNFPACRRRAAAIQTLFAFAKALAALVIR